MKTNLRKFFAGVLMFMSVSMLFAANESNSLPVEGGTDNSSSPLTYRKFVNAYFMFANAISPWKILSGNVNPSGKWVINVTQQSAGGQGQADSTTQTSELFNVHIGGTISKESGGNDGNGGTFQRFDVYGQHTGTLTLEQDKQFIAQGNQSIFSLKENATAVSTAYWKYYLSSETEPSLWTSGSGTISFPATDASAGVYTIKARRDSSNDKDAQTATVTVVKITANATDLFGTIAKNDAGSNETAYVHWNIDNDNNATSGGTTEHPGGDYLKTNTIVNGEDDLKSFSFIMTPAMNEGSIEISVGTNGKVWKSATKGVSSGVNKQLLLDAGATKVWDLSNAAQSSEFNSIGTVYIEGVGNGNATFTIKYKDDKGAEVTSDSITYTFIAANCGRQPSVTQKTVLLNAFPGLVGCEWSVTGNATISYNCIAWTVGITNMWVNGTGITGPGRNKYYISIDRSYGNNDGTMTMNELDAFYDANGYTPTDLSSADIMYYSNYHGARKKSCLDGAGKWNMFESKCGNLERIEHLRDQLNGSSYGFPVRYYKAK